MANKNPRCRMVSVPSEFMPLLEEELTNKGFFSYPQLMDHILGRYFKKAKTPVKATVREVDEQ